MAREAHRLMIDAFHQAAVTGDHPGAVVYQIIAVDRVQMTLGKRKAHRHGKALPQRPGGAFHAVEKKVLRMAGARAAELAEIADILDRRLGVATEVQQRIDQHRSMAGRKDEPVPVRPVRIGRVELQEILEQDGRSVCHAHRHAGVAAIGRLHRVHR